METVSAMPLPWAVKARAMRTWAAKVGQTVLEHGLNAIDHRLRLFLADLSSLESSLDGGDAGIGYGLGK